MKKEERKIKAQASFEFISIYAWIFIAIAIAVGALYYLGFLDFAQYAGQTCEFNSQIKCKDFSLGTDSVKLKLLNNFGKQVHVKAISIVDDFGNSLQCDPIAEFDWNDFQTKDVVLQDCSGPDYRSGRRAKLNIKLEYYSLDTPTHLLHAINGIIDAKIVPGPSPPPVLSLSCSVAPVCSGTTVFKISDLSNAHAELASESNYPNLVCCQSSSYVLGTSCASGYTLLKLSDITNAHVEENIYSNYLNDACLSSGTGTLSCAYVSGDCFSAGYDACVATISSDTNAHVADCVTDPYVIRICCKIT